MRIRADLALALGAGLCLSAQAQTEKRPQIIDPAPGSSLMISRISDNGMWGVAEKVNTTDGDTRPVGGILIDLNTLDTTQIAHGSGFSGVSDVTDDGRTVVGECNGVPAYWTPEGWQELPLPTGFAGGRLSAVTPDGHYAVGYVSPGDDIYQASPVMYDLQKNAIVETPGLPLLDMTHLDQKQTTFSDISSDGRYILGTMSMSYIQPPSLCSYVYDRETSTYKMIGFTEDDTKPWTSLAKGLYFVDFPTMSPNGQYVTGFAYMSHAVSGSQFAEEYYAGFRYNVESNEFEVYDGDADSDVAGFSVTNDGTVLGATPAQNPYSRCMVRSGKYYYDLGQILSQAYGIDFDVATSYGVTGKPVAVSSDGLTMLMVPSTTESYILKLQEPLTEAVSKVDLLGAYTASPATGTVMTSIGTVSITFDRDVEIAGDATSIKIVDKDGNSVRNALRASADGNIVTIGFRTQSIPQGETYTVVVPAGIVTIAGDRDVKCKEIRIEYVGRGEGGVQVAKAYPADDASVSSIDLSSNPVLVDFDAQIQLNDPAAVAKLWREGEGAPYCDLYAAVQGNRMMLYPLSGQNLYEGTDYRLEIPADMVCDLSGNGGNAAITFRYHGAYVRQINSDEKFIFAEDCSNFENFLVYEGDRLKPATTPEEWGFTADTTPWWVARDSDTDSNMSFVSHSMYVPAGESDDWLMTPQLYIPDGDCYLAFLSQSYLKDKQDVLKVYVYSSDNVYNTLTEELVNTIRKEGKLVYDKVQTPGESEEMLAGDWTENTVKLDEYAGKNIYIAFVNNNNDQSAIFLDDIQVVHDMMMLTAIETPARVVAQEQISIKGVVTIASEVETFSELTLTLRDAAGTEIDRIQESGLSLKENDTYHFEFTNPLPLTVGKETVYTVDIASGDYNTSVRSSVKNLSFEPRRKIVLEEYSGAQCGNCPLGLATVEYLESLYADSFIPVIIRTYQGDPHSSGLGAYSQYLGLDAAGAPSGRINRKPVAYPMISVEQDYRFSGEGIINETTGQQEMLWFDYARQLLSEPVEMELDFSNTYSAGSDINVTCQVRNALDVERQNVNVFAVIVEDNLPTSQSNYLSSVTDADLGEWGAGGKYGRPNVRLMLDDVARGVYGVTFNGTGGLVPTDMTSGTNYTFNFSMPMSEYVSDANNCHLVVMLIDANTGEVINANKAAINGSTSGVSTNVANGSTAIALRDGAVVASGEGNVSLEVYSASGALVSSARGNGNAEAQLNGYVGVAIARATAADGSVTRKFIIR